MSNGNLGCVGSSAIARGFLTAQSTDTHGFCPNSHGGMVLGPTEGFRGLTQCASAVHRETVLSLGNCVLLSMPNFPPWLSL